MTRAQARQQAQRKHRRTGGTYYVVHDSSGPDGPPWDYDVASDDDMDGFYLGTAPLETVGG